MAMKPFCVIPARGGSKRVPRKNIRSFCGKPMIAYSIEAALGSGLFSHVVVSTDDEEIATVAKQWGAEVPYMRPAELANDFVNSDEVMAYDIKTLCELYGTPAYACLLYATAPFVRMEDLQKGYALISAGDCQSAFTVCSFPFPIQRALHLDSNNLIEMIRPENRYVRSQDLEETFHDAGQFYWCTTEGFKARKDLMKDAKPIHIPRYLVQDIDTPEDWETAEYMMAALQKK